MHAASKFIHSFIFVSLLATGTNSHPSSHDFADVIDLGYARHMPTWINRTSTGTELLNYNNIRYAEPPVGERRFRKPHTTPPYQQGIQDGNMSSWNTDCICSAPGVVPFPLLNGSTWGSEDCLFLNVVKPKHAKPGDKLPVLHWVIGSAYAFGSKDWTGFGLNTYGIFNRPLNLTDQFIIVTHNYRLGVPGWLPKFDEDMNGNLGVWDTLAAVEWTKKHISKFGGDPEQITVIGQSAGAGVITWLLLGEEGNLELPFDQAWIASADIPPRKNLERYRSLYDQVLNHTGCTTVECMRHLPESAIRDANTFALIESPSGVGGGTLGVGIGFAPSVDGELVSDLPVNAFAAGKFNKKLKRVVVGNTAYEGLGLSSDSDMPRRFPQIVRGNIPNASNKTIDTLLSLYPYPADLPESLAWNFVTDIIWSCNVGNIARAYGDKAHRFKFSIPPATHALDLFYLFFADNTTTPVSSVNTAYAAEKILLEYMFRKDFSVPASANYTQSFSEWRPFSDNKTIANITSEGFQFVPLDQTTEQRCAYINSLLTDPSNGV